MLIPHLHFNGDCSEAIALYKKAFNSKAETIVFNRQYNPTCDDDGIAHAVMKIHGQTVYLNDRFGNINRSTDIAVHLIIMFKTTDELLACYEILKQDSITIDRMEELPYSPLAVQFIDCFGVQWGFMVEEGK
ncbi:MAG: VOC family protein [Clostridia bacterium]